MLFNCKTLSNEDWNIHREGHAPVSLKCNIRRMVQRPRNDPRNEKKFAGNSEKGGSKRSSVHLSATVTKFWTSAYMQVKDRGEGEWRISGACRKMDVQARIGWVCMRRNLIFLPRHVSNLMWQQQKMWRNKPETRDSNNASGFPDFPPTDSRTEVRTDIKIFKKCF